MRRAAWRDQYCSGRELSRRAVWMSAWARGRALLVGVSASVALLAGCVAPGASNTKSATPSADAELDQLDDETIERVLRVNYGAFQSCINRAPVAMDWLDPRLHFSWLIAQDGSTREIRVERSDVQNPAAEACLTEVIQKLTFPRAKHGTKFSYAVRLR